MDHVRYKKIEDWLQRKFINRKCEVCDQNSWALSDDEWGIRDISTDRNVDGFEEERKIIPLVSLICNNCGNVKMFNTLMIL